MFSCFGLNAKHKPNKVALKVWDNSRKKRIGIPTDSLCNLKSEISKQFEIEKSVPINLVLEEDGTEIDDEEVFAELPQHTKVMVLTPGENWEPDSESIVDQLERSLSALLKSNRRQNIATVIQNLIQNGKNTDLHQVLGHLVATMEQNIPAETRDKDPDWFKGQQPSKKTKCDVMKDCARRRVRNYYHSAMDQIKTAKKRKLSPQYEQIFDNFLMELKENDHYADYFDRKSAKLNIKMCDDSGWFLCEGSYDVNNCVFFDHRINPYGSRANYLIFSTWNLDHRIEKSREVLPSLMKAQDSLPKTKTLDWLYFFKLLFTRSNLKLVHVSCHDKSEHDSEKCDPNLFYESS